ncbi:MAG: iron chelate uptake ABC transporter family permease subunit [Bacilli bacterium]
MIKQNYFLFVLTLCAMIGYAVIGLDMEIFQYTMETRLPKMLAMFIAAICIAGSTLLFQTVTHNRLLTPSILGLDSLYQFLQTMIAFFIGVSSPLLANKTLNFMFVLVLMIGSTVLLYKLFFKRFFANTMTLLFIGIVFGTFLSSLTGFMQKLIDPNDFASLHGKLYASLSNMNTEILLVSLCLLVLIIPFIYDDFHKLDVVLLGRESAINLGVNYHAIVIRMLLVVVILVSIATALIGPITFLGVVVVNIAYEWLKTYKHVQLMLGSVFIAIIVVFFGQMLVEQLFNYTTTLSVLVNLLGGSYFIYLLVRENKK